jgi:hypothetical protein
VRDTESWRRREERAARYRTSYGLVLSWRLSPLSTSQSSEGRISENIRQITDSSSALCPLFICTSGKFSALRLMKDQKPTSILVLCNQLFHHHVASILLRVFKEEKDRSIYVITKRNRMSNLANNAERVRLSCCDGE